MHFSPLLREPVEFLANSVYSPSGAWRRVGEADGQHLVVQMLAKYDEWKELLSLPSL